MKGKTTGAQAYSREREDATLRRHRLLELNWEKALLLLLPLQQHAVSPIHSFLSLIFSFSFFLLSIRVAPANELFSASVRFQNSFFFLLFFFSCDGPGVTPGVTAAASPVEAIPSHLVRKNLLNLSFIIRVGKHVHTHTHTAARRGCVYLYFGVIFHSLSPWRLVVNGVNLYSITHDGPFSISINAQIGEIKLRDCCWSLDTSYIQQLFFESKMMEEHSDNF